MRPNTLRRLHSEGRTIVNAWLSNDSAYVAEAAAHQGYDAVTVDMQHGMVGFDRVVAMFQAISTTAAIPMARPSENNPAEIMRLLDAGAYGIICPMISTAEDAARLVSACRYPPVGRRSFGPSRGLLYGGLDYFSGANDEILVFPMIETIQAVDNIEAILDTPGIDGIYVGPNDLSIEMGQPPRNEPNAPAVMAAITRAREATTRRGLIAGIFCSDGAAAAGRAAEGFHLVTPGNDIALLRATFATNVRAARGHAA
jgi:4-hydroxy-2-oxoheptanedioate aldolase